jgi:hypothetical protein
MQRPVQYEKAFGKNKPLLKNIPPKVFTNVHERVVIDVMRFRFNSM